MDNEQPPTDPNLMDLYPNPATFWQIFEVMPDGDEAPCKDMAQAYPKPDELMPALKKLLAQDRNVHIRPVDFTNAMAVETIKRGVMSSLQIQLATGWSNEVMALIDQSVRVQAAEKAKQEGTYESDTHPAT